MKTQRKNTSPELPFYPAETPAHPLFNIAEVQVRYEPQFHISDKPVIGSAKDLERLLRQVWNPDTLQYLEEFYIILLNRANRVLGISLISKGGMSGTVADPKVIFTIALKGNAHQLLLAHNHPSGGLKPSEADLILTRRLVQIGKLLDLPVIDHLILTQEGCVSFADEGWM